MESKKEIISAVTGRMLQVYRYLFLHGIVQNKATFCSKIGILPQNFTLFESGRQFCSVMIAYNLGVEFGVSLDWLFYGNGEMFVNG